MRVRAAGLAAAAMLVGLAFATGAGAEEESGAMNAGTWTRAEIFEQLEKSGRAYREFLRVPSLHAGMYFLPAGAVDNQRPHAEDEVYYVLRGRASFRAGDDVSEIGEGSVLFVRANVPHKFENIEEDLEVLVFFSSAKPEE